MTSSDEAVGSSNGGSDEIVTGLQDITLCAESDNVIASNFEGASC
jgi:hypothetical protein